MIYKIMGIGLIAVFLSLTTKKISKEAASLVSILAGIIIVILLLPYIREITENLQNFSADNNIPNNYIKLLIKVLGIGFLSEFCASVAKDAGENSIAQKIQFGGKVLIMVLAMPLFNTLITIITDLL
ncbi:MAG: stage III sporulation protein AD [Clostridia bacterium]|nr:stage III sporulation protein AD [Clostridia bacterium]